MSTAVFGAPGFRARSGRTVSTRSDGSVMFDHVNGYLSPASVMDAEEYFQAKRDAELGRWRSPLHPAYVVYPAGDVVRVVGEHVGISQQFERDSVSSRSSRIPAQVAAAYFEAHPESKPWHDAKPGEVWLLTVDGHEAHFVAAGKEFNGTNEFGRFICCAHDDEDITAGRRIYPGDAS